MIVYDFMAKTRGRLGIVLAFVLGAVCAGLPGFLVGGQQSGKISDLDKRHADYERAATATIAELESNLERERKLTQGARTLVGGLTKSTDRNIRNLQDALVLIKEIRGQIAVLAEFYVDRDPPGSAERGDRGTDDGAMNPTGR
jgi:hypothetical protein